jgi:acyl-coenzyme A thioesterase PaaI-like protein
MSRIVVNNYVTLDGVMQAPGHPDEDRRGGFQHGGWAGTLARAVASLPIEVRPFQEVEGR